MTETFIHPYDDLTGRRWELVAELYAAGYNWAIAVIWRDKMTGRFYGDSDRGCSCYGPFEEGGARTMGELTEITTREQAKGR